jgi:DNA-binding transcriptional ArsR family regulator
MPRARTTLDAFNAVAEPRRRAVLNVLARGELPVAALVRTLSWPQPQVSKHLAVLRKVGIVSVRRRGRERMYSVNGQQMKALHDWAKTFERFWENQLVRIKTRAEQASASATHKEQSP